jgi:hypothetical protein
LAWCDKRAREKGRIVCNPTMHVLVSHPPRVGGLARTSTPPHVAPPSAPAQGVILNKDRVGIYTALALLIVATVQLPLAYNKDVCRFMAGLAGKVAPRRRVASLALQFAGCFITLALPVAAAFAALVLAASVSPDETVLPGYPQLEFERLYSGRSDTDEHRFLKKVGLETVVTITVALTPDAVGLSATGAACFAFVLGFAAYAVWHEDRKQLRKAASIGRDKTSTASF